MKTTTMLLLELVVAGWLGAGFAMQPESDSTKPDRSIAAGAPIQYRVGFMGHPATWHQFQMVHAVPWTRENLQRLKDLGFNTIQINVAWGTRPADEALNLEDIVRLEEPLAKEYFQPVELRSKPGEEAYQRRRQEVQTRSELCKTLGLRTIFHFGAPYNAREKYQGTEPNCILDDKTVRRYELLLERFARDFPNVDDILVYTYDQDAWLCSEFAKCPRCAAVPLYQRLPGFVNRLAANWRKARSDGRLWWEPWGDVLGGESYQCLKRLQPEGIGLAIHVNNSEVMATFPVDRWAKNMAALAAERGIPVIVEYFLGGSSEEVLPLTLAHPLVTLRGLQAIANVPGVVGIKEYYGLSPEREDPNLRMTALFFKNPQIDEAEALRRLAEPYGEAAENVQEIWRLSSSAMDFFPWEATWFFRCIGDRSVMHGLDKEFKLQPWPQQVIYPRTVAADRDPSGMLDDLQQRLEEAATRWQAAEKIGREITLRVPGALKESFTQILLDTGRIRRRASSLAYHMRETNLARLMRSNTSRPEAAERARKELLSVLRADRENFREEIAVMPIPPLGTRQPEQWKEIDTAIELLQEEPAKFLDTFLNTFLR